MEINLEKDKVDRAVDFLARLRVRSGDVETYIKKLEGYVICFYAKRRDDKKYPGFTDKIITHLPGLLGTTKNLHQVYTIGKRGLPFNRWKKIDSNNLKVYREIYWENEKLKKDGRGDNWITATRNVGKKPKHQFKEEEINRYYGNFMKLRRRHEKDFPECLFVKAPPKVD